MPRISAEARSAAAYRAGGDRPQAPSRMTAAAKLLWDEIVADRPVDFFRPGSLGMLEAFCQLTIEHQRIVKELANTRVGTGDYLSMQKLASRNSAMMATFGSKLRLTVQAEVERHSRKISERGDASADDGLIGGSAARGKLRVVKA